MTPSAQYDLVILGGGAAAFAAITEADRRDLSTAIVNTGLPLGGTCVNVGCVPSKHLLEVGKTGFEPPQNPFDAVTYDEDQPKTDWAAAIDEKDAIVASLREQNYVDVAEHFETDVYEGYGQFVDSTTIDVVDAARVERSRVANAYKTLNTELGISDAIRHRAVALSKHHRETAISNGCRPSGVAAACIYKAAQEHGRSLTQQRVADAAGMSAVTVRARRDELNAV